MTTELQKLLTAIKQRLPEGQQGAFAKGIKARIDTLEAASGADTGTLLKYTIGGMAVGAVLDLVPGLETLTGVDGFIDVGAAIGAYMGYSKSEEDRRHREFVRRIIIEELNRLVPAA
jgi:hypothetical protein